MTKLYLSSYSKDFTVSNRQIYSFKIKPLAFFLMLLSLQVLVNDAFSKDYEINDSTVLNDSSTNPLTTNKQWFSVVDEYRNINLNVKNLNKDVDIFAAFTNKSWSITDNKLNLDATSHVNSVISGFANGQSASMYNTLTVSGSANLAIAGFSKNSYTRTNSLVINDTGVVYNAIAGFSDFKDSNYNDLEIYGEVTNAISGYANNNSDSNELLIYSTANIKDKAIGSYAKNGNATYSYVHVDNGAKVNNLIGGLSEQGNSQGNFIEVLADVNTLTAGASEVGSAFENTVIAYSGANINDLIGANAGSSAYSNYVTLESGSVVNNLNVAIANEDAAYNILNADGTVTGKITVATSNNGTALLNRAHIHQNAQLNDGITVATSKEETSSNVLESYGTINGNVTVGASDNTANFNVAYLYNDVDGNINVAQGKNAAHNSVFVKDTANIKGDVIAADALDSASSNLVSIAKGTSVTGNVYGGKSSSESYLNVVNIFGEVSGNVYGGYGNNAHNNTVVLNNSKVTGDIFASYRLDGAISNNNIVSLSGDNEISGAIYASSNQDATHSEISENNTLFVAGHTSVSNLFNFNNLILDVDSSNKHTEDGKRHHILTITEDNLGATKALDLRNTTIIVHGSGVKADADIDLIYAKDGIHTDETTVVKGSDTFIFDTWTPINDMDFEHELDLSSLEHEKVVSNITDSFASFINADLLVLDNNARLLQQKFLKLNEGVFVSFDANTLDYDNSINSSIDSFALNVGYNLKVNDKVNTYVFVDFLKAQHKGDAIGIDTVGQNNTVTYANYKNDLNAYSIGLGALYKTSIIDINASLISGLLCSDSSHSFVKDEQGQQFVDDIDFDTNRFFVGTALNVSHEFQLSPFANLNPNAFYKIHYVGDDTSTLNDDNNSNLVVDDSFIQSYGVSLDGMVSLNDNFSLTSSIIYYLVDNDDGSVKISNYDFDSNEDLLDSLLFNAGASFCKDNFKLDFNVFLNTLDIEGYGASLKSSFRF